MSMGGTAIGAPRLNGSLKMDPGPPVPGYNCHIVIDGVGYIFADIASYASESGKSVTNEQLAPYFGDPQNALDTLSSDMTMLLPIGQGDFKAGMGFTDLEKQPDGFDRSENLIITPQGTLFNGPIITAENLASTPTSPTADGYFGGTVAEAGALNYFGIGSNLYYNSGSSWLTLPTRASITDIRGYSGRIIVGYGASGGDVFYSNAPYQSKFNITKTAVVNGNPYIIDRIGRIYAAFIFPPAGNAISITDETGPDPALANYAYAVRYLIKLPDNSLFGTGIGALFFATKLPNRELIIGIPARGYRGGPVLRQLYRTTNNDLTELYLLADETVLGPDTVRYVDTTSDATLITKPKYDWNTQNTTGNMVLLAGEVTRNMQFPDTFPIWLPENMVAPYVGDYIQSVASYHDTNGDESLLIGTSSGLFAWDGGSLDFQTLYPTYYHAANFKYLTVNHGAAYFTLQNTTAWVWTPVQQSEIQGPWLSHFNVLTEIRLANVGRYVVFAVRGVFRTDGLNTTMLYLFDGTRFVWGYRYNDPVSANTITALGQSTNSNDLLFYAYAAGSATVQRVNMNPMPGALQTNGSSYFRSALSDGDLPRLRKQIHAVMVRHLHLTAQPAFSLTAIANVNDTSITLNSVTGLIVGDWIRIDDPNVIYQEYRRVANIVGNVITLGHALGAGLKFTHAAGTTVRRCGAITTLRNVFTDTMSNSDIEIGGPCLDSETFAYIRLPVPVYSYVDGIEIRYRSGTIMELLGWAMLTGLNPQWNGLSDMTIRLQDFTKLPNNLYDNATAAVRQEQLKTAYNKGTVEVVDPLGVKKLMRFQRLTFAYEEPKERHSDGRAMQATASVRLIDELAELNKAQQLVVGQIIGQPLSQSQQ